MAGVVEQAVEAFHAKCLVDAVTIEAAAAATTTTAAAATAAASSSSSQQSLDSSSFAFPKFRDVWKEKNLTSEVLNLVGACSSARDACETVQVTNERKKEKKRNISKHFQESNKLSNQLISNSLSLSL